MATAKPRATATKMRATAAKARATATKMRAATATAAKSATAKAATSMPAAASGRIGRSRQREHQGRDNGSDFEKSGHGHLRRCDLRSRHSRVIAASKRTNATAHPISVNGASGELFRLHAARGPREGMPRAATREAVR